MSNRRNPSLAYQMGRLIAMTGRYAYQKRKYVTPAALAYGASRLRPIHTRSYPVSQRGLGPSSWVSSGAAAPISSNKLSYRRRRKIQERRRAKCRKMKGYALKNKVCSLENQIKDLKLTENASLGTFTHKVLYSEHFTTSANGKQYGVVTGVGFDMPRFADTVQYLKYYNPATPGTLTTADFESGTFDRRILFKSLYFGGTFRNNYQTDVKLRVYLVKPKQSSSISPTTAWQNGIDSNGDASLTTYLQIGQYPSEFSDFKDTWSSKMLSNTVLSPGQSVKVSHTENNVEFDPSAYDQHNATYQSKYKNFHILAFVEGTLGHDASLSTDGLCRGGCDVVWLRKAVVQYAAGVNIEFIKVENNMDDMTTPVQSHQPTPDNIAYSQS